MKPKKLIKKSVYFPEEMEKSLRHLAIETGQTFSEIVQEAAARLLRDAAQKR